MALMRARLATMPVRDAMLAELATLAPTDTLREAADKMFTSFQEDFPVVDGDRLAGLFSKAQLLRQLARSDLSMPVSGSLDAGPVHTVDVGSTLDVCFTRLNSGECRALPVLREGKLVGLITLDQIADYLQIHQALERRRRAMNMSSSRPAAATPAPVAASSVAASSVALSPAARPAEPVAPAAPAGPSEDQPALPREER